MDSTCRLLSWVTKWAGLGDWNDISFPINKLCPSQDDFFNLLKHAAFRLAGDLNT